MDFIRRNKLLGSLVIVLVIFNAALLIFLWFGRLENNKPKDPIRGNQFLEEQLDLSESQITQLKSLRQEHFKLIEQHQKELNETRRQMHSLWNKENSTEQAKTLSAKMGDIQAKIEYATYNHFASIRAICTPEQQQTFDKIISNVLRPGQRGDRPQDSRPPQQGGPEGKRPPPRDGR